MKRFLTSILTVLFAIGALAQNVPALEQLKADPRKAYGTDYPYGFKMEPITPSSISPAMPVTAPAITGTTGCTSSWTPCCWPRTRNSS